MRRRYWIGLIVVAVAAVAAAGGALAATKLQSPANSSKAVINDAAHRLNVSPGALSGALRQALDDQIDAAVAAGRLTKEQGDALKARVDSGRLPFFGEPGLGFGFRGPHPGFGFRFAGPGVFAAGSQVVTSYLGISPAQLRSALAVGKSLGQIAQEHGKTASGLVSALTAAAKSQLDKAVAAGRLTSAQEQKILAGLQTMLTNLVNRTPGKLEPHPGFGFAPGFGFRGRGRYGMHPGKHSSA